MKPMPVDPNGLDSCSEDEILYPGVSSKQKRLLKLKKREEDMASQVLLGHKGKQIFRKAQIRNSHIVPRDAAKKEIKRLDK